MGVEKYLIDKLPDEYYTKVNALKSALDDLIVYQKTDIWATNGLSIYFPYENKTRINDIIYLYKKFDFASDYTEFIDNFTATLTGKRIFTGNVDDAEVHSSVGGIVSVTIPEELSANYSDASYVIFEKLDDGYYMPRYKGTDVKGQVCQAKPGRLFVRNGILTLSTDTIVTPNDQAVIEHGTADVTVKKSKFMTWIRKIFKGEKIMVLPDGTVYVKLLDTIKVDLTNGWIFE